MNTRLLGAAVAFSGLLLYALSAPSWVVGGDNGEFVTLFAHGGVAHPSGYPLYIMALRLGAWAPVTAAHGSALVTALIGAMALYVLHRACVGWGASGVSSTLVCAVFASSSLMWRLSSTAEVFALNVLIACAIVAAAAPNARTRGWKRAAQLGLFVGLGLSNHHSVVLLAPIALYGVTLSFIEEPWRVRCAAALSVSCLIGLSPYAYTFYEASHASANAWVWGNIHDLGSLFAHFRRAEFGTTRLALHDSPLDPEAQLRFLGLNLLTNLLALPLLLLVTVALLIRRRARDPRCRWGQLALFASFLLAGPLFVMVMNISPRGVGALTVERFHLLPAALACVLGSLAIDQIVSDRRKPILFAITALAFVANAALSSTHVAEDHRPTVDMYVKNTLRFAPERAIILGSGDHKVAGFMYGQHVLGLRPDVVVVTPEMLYADWYRARINAQLGLELTIPTPDRVSLVSQLASTHRPVAFAGGVPSSIVDAGYVVSPSGTLQIVEPPGSPTPDAIALEIANVALLGQFELESQTTATSSSWAGTTFNEYARTWLTLAVMLDKRGETLRASECRRRASVFAPWL